MQRAGQLCVDGSLPDTLFSELFRISPVNLGVVYDIHVPPGQLAKFHPGLFLTQCCDSNEFEAKLMPLAHRKQGAI